MSESSFPPRSAAHKTSQKPSATATLSVALESDAHALLKSSAQKLNLREKAFASAAIRYMALNGLDPTQLGGLAEGVKTRAEISEASHAMRQATAELGSQVTQQLDVFKRELHQLLGAQQARMLDQLDYLEANIQAHQTALEIQLLVPLLQRMITLNVESHLSAQLLQQLLLKFENIPCPPQELKVRTDAHSQQVTAYALTHLQTVQHTARVAQGKLARQPLPAKSTLAVALANSEPADPAQAEVP